MFIAWIASLLVLLLLSSAHHGLHARVAAGRVHYAVDPLRCTRCGVCARACPEGAIQCTPGSVTVDAARCLGCGRCAEICRRGALVRFRAPSGRGGSSRVC